MRLIAIDFEASCLPSRGRRSYPIEVGIADAGGHTRSWLIRPDPAWEGWDWTQEAQNLHGIRHERLCEEGLPPALVMAELREELRGARVIADSHLDGMWMETLALAAASTAPAALEHVVRVLDELGSTNEEILAAQTELAARGFKRHRAGDDARWLSALIQMLREACERRGNPEQKRLFRWQTSVPAGARAASPGHHRREIPA